MSSPVIDALEAIGVLWEALTPPDRIAVKYRAVTGRGRPAGRVSSDRQFGYGLPRRTRVAGQSGAASSTVEWSASLVLQLGQSGRDNLDLATSVGNEVNLLSRAIEKCSVWPSGVLSVITQEPQLDQATEHSEVTATFEVQILTFETD